MNTQLASGKAFWSCAGFTLFSALVSATFSMLALGMVGTGHQHEYALYAASRSVALLLAATFAVGRRSWGGVAAMATAMTIVQLLDTVTGILIHNPGQTYGPALFTLINLTLLIWMSLGVVRPAR
jgi:hypothetical protein